MKTEESRSAGQKDISAHATHADTQPNVTLLDMASRRIVQTGDEAKQQVISMHHCTPAWKSPECVTALSEPF